MTLKKLEELAVTARLGLTESERKMFPEQISRILACAQVLQSIDTKGVVPTIYPMEQAGVLREDKVVSSLDKVVALANGPEVADGYFRVPRIIEED
ncbi:MAG: Asp-tRNA(Asn)/Glu-tRNA(Gln) amidotransferase subunit GatC [Firmicutes bacterium]|nr:Asp-tRNA(Asn)/Glu-tRNA(Gln) amidotransferase subunit GatC [Bacillota bacterium]